MKILIGIPTYDRRIDVELCRILLNVDRAHRYDLDLLFPISSHLSRNRNFVCKEALVGGHDAILFLDSDIGISDERFLDKLVDTSYRFDAKIVGGAYKMKDGSGKYIAGMKTNNGKYRNLTEVKTGLVDAVGTGIMLVMREVLLAVADPWFTMIDKPNLDIMPEDFEFCRKAQELGYKLALECGFETRHYGSQSWIHSPNHPSL